MMHKSWPFAILKGKNEFATQRELAVSDKIDFLTKTSSSIQWGYEFLSSGAFTAFLDLIPEAAILSDEQGRVILTNQTAQAVFGFSKEEFNKQIIEDLVPQKIRSIHANLRKDFFEEPTPRFLESRNLDLHACRQDGTEFPMESALFSIQTDKGPIAVNLIRDITERKEAQKKISEYAFVDSLTNLPNRRYFDANLKRNVAKAKRHQQMIGLLYIDLDKFKPINDNFGHDYGDLVLQEISSRLASTVRDEDFVARIGGDEFIIMVYPADGGKYLEELAKRVLEACVKPVKAKGELFDVGASIGVSFSQSSDVEATQLIKKADKAMYRAKEQGGNCYALA